jgi:predicted secreted protein
LEAHDVALKPGGIYRLEIGGLGSAGYAWSYEVTGAADIVNVTLDAAAPPPPPTGATLPNSFSVPYVLSVVALKQGSATVHLSLQRPWEKQKPPLREISVHVTVGDDR